jgi:hypothetical protein
MTETPETAGREQGGKLGWHPPCYARALIRKFRNQGIWLKNRYPAQSSLFDVRKIFREPASEIIREHRTQRAQCMKIIAGKAFECQKMSARYQLGRVSINPSRDPPQSMSALVPKRRSCCAASKCRDGVFVNDILPS